MPWFSAARCHRLLAGPQSDDLTLLHLVDCGQPPRAVQDGLVGPIGADAETKRAVRRRQPVAFPILALRPGAGIERQRTVHVIFKGLVLRVGR